MSSYICSVCYIGDPLSISLFYGLIQFKRPLIGTQKTYIRWKPLIYLHIFNGCHQNYLHRPPPSHIYQCDLGQNVITRPWKHGKLTLKLSSISSVAKCVIRNFEYI